jgi:amino acid adenylation domain-containing protein
VVARVQEIAADSPRRLAVSDGGRRLGYGDLLHAAAQVSAELMAAGCRPGDVVATACARRAESVVLLLALESLGCVYVPLSAAWTTEQAEYALSASGARMLADHCGCGKWAGLAGVRGVRVCSDSGAGTELGTGRGNPSATASLPRPERQGLRWEPRYGVFTSGSTGRPKGALVAHGGMMNHLETMAATLSLGPSDRVAFTAPTGHVIAIWQMLAALLAGGAVVVVSEAEAYPPRRLLCRLHDEAVTVVQAVPTVLAWLTAEAGRAHGSDLRAVRWFVSTGEALTPDVAGRLLAAFPHVRLLNAYGASECSDDVTHQEVSQSADHVREVPIGRPIPGVCLYRLLPGDGGWRAAEEDEVGELFVGGEAVGLGYFAHPAATPAAGFFHDPFSSGAEPARLYRTGDLVRLVDGLLHFEGRGDRQAKLGGVRVEPDAIEVALRTHPQITQAAALVRRQGDRSVLVAFYTAASHLDPTDLRRRLAASLPAHTLPRDIVQVKQIPLNGNGKTDYTALSKEGAVEE